MWEAHIATHTYQMPNVVGNRNVKDAVKEGSGGGLGAVVMDGGMLLKPRGKKGPVAKWQKAHLNLIPWL